MIDNYRDHAANERTFLAWVRTVVAVAGFGIAGARIGAGPVPVGWQDALILAVGAVVVALAWLRMQMIRRRIDSPRSASDEAGPVDLMLALMVIAFFVLLGSFAVRLST